jgi:hypothetical protein
MTVTSLSLYRVHVLLLDPAFRSLDDCDLTQPLQGSCSAVRLPRSGLQLTVTSISLSGSLFFDVRQSVQVYSDCDLTQPLKGPCSNVRPSVQVSNLL